MSILQHLLLLLLLQLMLLQGGLLGAIDELVVVEPNAIAPFSAASLPKTFVELFPTTVSNFLEMRDAGRAFPIVRGCVLRR